MIFCGVFGSLVFLWIVFVCNVFSWVSPTWCTQIRLLNLTVLSKKYLSNCITKIVGPLFYTKRQKEGHLCIMSLFIFFLCNFKLEVCPIKRGVQHYLIL